MTYLQQREIIAPLQTLQEQCLADNDQVRQ